MSEFSLDLVTVAQAKTHLRAGSEMTTDEAEGLISRASNIVLDYLKLTSIPDAWTESGTGSPSEVQIPGAVQAATLLVIGVLDKDKIGEMDPLTPGARSLLHRFRDPALA